MQWETWDFGMRILNGSIIIIALIFLPRHNIIKNKHLSARTMYCSACGESINPSCWLGNDLVVGRGGGIRSSEFKREKSSFVGELSMESGGGQ